MMHERTKEKLDFVKNLPHDEKVERLQGMIGSLRSKQVSTGEDWQVAYELEDALFEMRVRHIVFQVLNEINRGSVR